ncbi:MAG: peptidylprolyl isomerase [Nanoarchaeota archaeon]
MKTKKGDFIELDYTAKEKDTNRIFDTTKADDAKKCGMFNPKYHYTPAKICIGDLNVIAGLDEGLENKELKNEFNVEILPEKAFGKRDAKLLQLVNTSKFTKQNMRPSPGLQLNIDGAIATIKSVSGGRTLIDFNHPFAGKTVVYTVIINRVITSIEEQLQTIVDFHLHPAVKTEINGEKAVVHYDCPAELRNQVTIKITSKIPSIKSVLFQH